MNDHEHHRREIEWPYHLLEPSMKPLRDWLEERNQPKFRADQIKKWIYQQGAASFDEMTDLPMNLRTKLSQDFVLLRSKIANHSKSSDGTEKLLLKLPDGARIECVLIRDKERRTCCVSTQVGCGMGCVFCATGMDGMKRNLTSGEIVEQLLQLRRLLPDGERLSHVVVMGMGEPLANIVRLMPALKTANSEQGLGISARRITISTVGLPKMINLLSDWGATYHLAVSLHAPNDELRSRLVPTNEKIGIADIVRAADRYFKTSGRRLTYEYVLLAGENDAPEHAQELVHLLKGRPALVNIIPFNPVLGLPYRQPTKEQVHRFCAILQRGGLTVEVRQKKGDDINAACGQLRRTKS